MARRYALRIAPLRPLALIAFAALAAGCTPPPPLIDVFPPDRSVAAVESGTGPLFLPVTTATRRLLPNETSLPGENYLMTLPAPRSGGTMSLARTLRAAGPLPHPFEYVIHTDLAPLAGSGGNLAYVSAQPADGVSCVLVAGTGASGFGIGAPLVMRNCVRGDADDALAPVLPTF